MAKFISTIRSQILDQRVEGGGEKLQAVAEAMIADLVTLKFLRSGRNDIARVGSKLYCKIRCESYPFKL